jgi:5-methylcytosine-specific restriction endonuclease McrA
VYCSRPCKDAAHYQPKLIERVHAKPLDRRCVDCGDVIPQRMRADARFCSVRCNHNAHSRFLKAMKRSGLRDAIIARDEGRCHWCGETVSEDEVTIDHVVHVSEGGTNHPKNLVLACRACNCSRTPGRKPLLSLSGS